MLRAAAEEVGVVFERASHVLDVDELARLPLGEEIRDGGDFALVAPRLAACGLDEVPPDLIGSAIEPRASAAIVDAHVVRIEAHEQEAANEIEDEPEPRGHRLGAGVRLLVDVFGIHEARREAPQIRRVHRAAARDAIRAALQEAQRGDEIVEERAAVIGDRSFGTRGGLRADRVYERGGLEARGDLGRHVERRGETDFAPQEDAVALEARDAHVDFRGRVTAVERTARERAAADRRRRGGGAEQHTLQCVGGRPERFDALGREHHESNRLRVVGVAAGEAGDFQVRADARPA